MLSPNVHMANMCARGHPRMTVALMTPGIWGPHGAPWIASIRPITIAVALANAIIIANYCQLLARFLVRARWKDGQRSESEIWLPRVSTGAHARQIRCSRARLVDGRALKFKLTVEWQGDYGPCEDRARGSRMCALPSVRIRYREGAIEIEYLNGVGRLCVRPFMPSDLVSVAF